MNLFSTKKPSTPVHSHPLGIQTPLGDLFFDCEIVNKSMIKAPPSKVEAIHTNSIVSSWIFDNYVVEFLRLSFTPKLPSEMKVDGCFCGVWRIRTFTEISCNFRCYLKSNLIGSLESGEGLLAQSFENEDTILSLGTEDEEYLKHRALLQDWLPNRFKFEIQANHISYTSNGINIKLPDLLKDEEVQIHFIVAWSSKKNPDISTWYAVDQSPREILRQADIQ